MVEGDEPDPGLKADGTEANARLTSSAAVVLLVLLALEGATLIDIRGLLGLHVFVGMLLVPPIALKMASTGYRFARYYLGSPAYRRQGPPPPFLRLLAPLVVVSTVVVMASGIALLVGPAPARQALLLLHKASFVVWFGAMTLHVLGHALDTIRIAPRDWFQRTRRDVAGAGLRQWAVVSSLVIGALLGLLLVGRSAPWLGWATAHLGH